MTIVVVTTLQQQLCCLENDQNDECLILCLLAPPPTQNGQQTLEFPLKYCMQPFHENFNWCEVGKKWERIEEPKNIEIILSKVWNAISNLL